MLRGVSRSLPSFVPKWGTPLRGRFYSKKAQPVNHALIPAPSENPEENHPVGEPRGHFPIRAHLQFLSDPTPEDLHYHPDFLQRYQSLYFIMTFLMRHRRNMRYAEYLRKLRIRTSGAEDLPSNVAVNDSESTDELLLSNLYLLKKQFVRQSLDKQLCSMDENLGKLRVLMQSQAGNIQDSDVTLRGLYQNLFSSIHNYDQAYFFDQVLPGKRSLLLTHHQFGSGPVKSAGFGRKLLRKFPKRPFQASKQFPFMRSKKRVVMLQYKNEEEDDHVQQPKQKYKVLGTLPNLMPRKQLMRYYELYLQLKQEESLPAVMAEDPYRAMRAFYRSWITWTLSQQKEIIQSQRRALRDTVSLASRMIRYHNSTIRGRLIQQVLGNRTTPALTEALNAFTYRAAVLAFTKEHLGPYIPHGKEDVVERLISVSLSSYPISPRELFDQLWKSLFDKAEPLSHDRLQKMRKKVLRIKYSKYLKTNPDPKYDQDTNHKMYLRWYILMKTVLAMSQVRKGDDIETHPSILLGKIRTHLLAQVFDKLIPVARLVSAQQMTANQRLRPDIFKGIGMQYRPSAAAMKSGKPSDPPQFELASKRLARDRYPVCHTAIPKYLRELERYRINHLLRTQELALNLTPGPAMPIQGESQMGNFTATSFPPLNTSSIDPISSPYPQHKKAKHTNKKIVLEPSKYTTDASPLSPESLARKEAPTNVKSTTTTTRPTPAVATKPRRFTREGLY